MKSKNMSTDIKTAECIEIKFGSLTVEYCLEKIDDGAGGIGVKVDPVSIQANLNTMIPYINQILDALPDEEKIEFLVNTQYPQGTFVLVTGSQATPIVPQYLLTRLQNTFPTAYIMAQGQNWGWSVVNTQTDISINDIANEFKNHQVACYNKYLSDGKALVYKMDFTFKVVATIPNSPQQTVSSSDKFYFTVKAVQ